MEIFNYEICSVITESLNSNLVQWCHMLLGTVPLCAPAFGAISVCTMPWKLLYVSPDNKPPCADIRSVAKPYHSATISYGWECRALPENNGASSAAFKFLSWKSAEKN